MVKPMRGLAAITSMPVRFKNMKPTEEQLKKYNDELYEHEQYCEKIKPKREDFETDDQYSAAMSEWFKIRFMDAPNEPGYYRANND